MGAQKINLLLSQLKVDKNKMTAFISEVIEADKNKRQAVIRKYFG
jgi:hypothetical protein